MKRMKISIVFSGIAFLAIAFLNGCSGGSISHDAMSVSGQTEEKQESKTSSGGSMPKQSEGVSAKGSGQASEHHQKIKVYYTDEQALELKEAEKEVSWTEKEGPFPSAFAALTKTDEPHSLSLWEGQELNRIQLNDGMLTIDLKAKETNLGSSIERLALLSLLNTMFQFPEVKNVQLLIDGKKVESLNGHMEIQQPFTKSMLADL